MPWHVDKTFGHDLGLSACFRQPNADSHCQEPHGYPLGFRFGFEADKLDNRNWVIDFGALKPLKQWLCDTFDHRLLLAEGDPAIPDFQALYSKFGWQPPIILPGVGCEMFALLAWQRAHELLLDLGLTPRVRVREVEVREHGANGATFVRK